MRAVVPPGSTLSMIAKLFDPVLTRFAARIAPAVANKLADTFGHAVRRHVDEILLPELHNRLLPELRDQLLPELQRRAEGVITADFLLRAAETISRNLADRTADIATNLFRSELSQNPLVGSELYLPSAVVVASQPGDYMSASVPRTRDFLHPKFVEFARLYGLPFVLHRKHWEWAFIHERLERAGLLKPGKKGLGFGVGREKLPALFAQAGVTITATDTPCDDQNWGDSAQYGGSNEALFAPDIIDRELFDQRVSFEPCDMTRLPKHLSGYDFCWSSCAFEHLGNLESGLEFVVNSLERCVAVGGIACHTTELNLSSDEETIESGRDVVYRRRDLMQLCGMLEERGHFVEPLRIEPGSLLPDYLVDLPPYRLNPHLKLRIGDFVATSIGLVIRRGR